MKVTGTIDLLRRAYDKGLVDKNRLVQALRQLREHGFRISDETIREAFGRVEGQNRSLFLHPWGRTIDSITAQLYQWNGNG